MDLAGRIVRRLRGEPDDPTVTGIEDEAAGELFDALGSETSRAVLAACYEDGRTRSELADELGTSVQNIGYHVDKLESAELLEAVETRYGSNGSEVPVYGPSNRAVVIAAGEPGFTDRLAESVRNLFAPVALAGLLSMVVGVLVRGPGPIGFAAGGTVTEITGARAGILVTGLTFLCSVLVILAATRNGVFDSDETSSTDRTGLKRELFGRNVATARRHAVLIAGIVLGSFLTLDLVAIGVGRRLTVIAWFAIQLSIPGGILLAAVLAYSNGGVVASWGAVSAPIVGIWAYVVAGYLSSGGFDPTLIAFGPIAVALTAAPAGSIAYLAGRTAEQRWREGLVRSLSLRAIGLLILHPILSVVAIVGYFAIVR